jgi:uncharacterized protein
MFFLYVYPLVLFLISYFLIIKPLQASKKIKLIVSFLFLTACCKNHIVLIFGGDLLSPDLPRDLLIALGCIHVSMLLLVIVACGMWMLKLIKKVILWREPIQFVLNPYILLFVICGALSLSIIATYNALRQPIIHSYTFYSKSYPKAPNKFRIIHLSDLHLGSNATVDQVSSYVDLINEQHGDVVLYTGDLIDGSPKYSAEQLKQLKRIIVPYGMYAVKGNHEYYSKNSVWDSEWPNYGIKMLDNAHVTIYFDGKPIYTIAGVTDEQSLKMNIPEEGPNLSKALNGINPNLPIILMDHRPNSFPEYAKEGIDLVLSGHTHGGMVPGLNKIIALFNNGFVSGLYRIGQSKLIVSNGLFPWGGFLVRMNIPAEIIVIDLVHQD